MENLVDLNEAANNGDDKYVHKYAKKVLKEFGDGLVGVELGSCYGGNVQKIAKLWKGKGEFYGFDTFIGHPKHLAIEGSFEQKCMDSWYTNDLFGTDKLDVEYQRKVLDSHGLDNAYLVKGEVNDQSCDFLDKIHYAFLDMDIPKSMEMGYQAVKDKIVPGGYLLLHDVIDESHIPDLHIWYRDKIKPDPMWEHIEDGRRYLVVLKRTNEKAS